MSGLCVTMTRVVLCFRLMSRRMSMTSIVFLVSRSPVGSSKSSSSGLLASARAMATRCCSPPDNSDGKWSMRSHNPTVVRSSTARFCLCFLLRTPRRVIGSSTFSKADMVARRLNVWKTNPILANLNFAR
mmetsp:Transcript_27293/g.89115  ORF Transcript_27293/g.89115 Transcript_27293/m.89115 type:complete len:130 (+) Transcript_27293:253-642(+)